MPYVIRIIPFPVKWIVNVWDMSRARVYDSVYPATHFSLDNDSYEKHISRQKTMFSWSTTPNTKMFYCTLYVDLKKAYLSNKHHESNSILWCALASVLFKNSFRLVKKAFLSHWLFSVKSNDRSLVIMLRQQAGSTSFALSNLSVWIPLTTLLI